MRHPMEMTASNGLVEALPAFESGLEEVVGEVEVLSMRERRFAEEAIKDGAAFADWTLPPSMSF